MVTFASPYEPHLIETWKKSVTQIETGSPVLAFA